MLTVTLWPAPTVMTSLGLDVETKFAVIVPAPLICAVVTAEVAPRIWMDPVKVHVENK